MTDCASEVNATTAIWSEKLDDADEGWTRVRWLKRKSHCSIWVSVYNGQKTMAPRYAVLEA